MSSNRDSAYVRIKMIDLHESKEIWMICFKFIFSQSKPTTSDAELGTEMNTKGWPRPGKTRKGQRRKRRKRGKRSTFMQPRNRLQRIWWVMTVTTTHSRIGISVRIGKEKINQTNPRSNGRCCRRGITRSTSIQNWEKVSSLPKMRLRVKLEGKN